MLPYRVTALRRRILLAVSIWVTAAAALWEVRADGNLSGRHPTQTASLVLILILLAWAIPVSYRAWRSATLIAATDKVTLRLVLKTFSWQWQEIDSFVVETRPTKSMFLSRPVLRHVIGIQPRSGQTRWCIELAARPAGTAASRLDAAGARLNEFLAAQAPQSRVDPHTVTE